MTAETRSAAELHFSRAMLASSMGPIELGGTAILSFAVDFRCECQSESS